MGVILCLHGNLASVGSDWVRMRKVGDGWGRGRANDQHPKSDRTRDKRGGNWIENVPNEELATRCVDWKRRNKSRPHPCPLPRGGGEYSCPRWFGERHRV